MAGAGAGRVCDTQEYTRGDYWGPLPLNTLKKDWKAPYSIAYILVTVKCLLIYLNPDSALEGSSCRRTMMATASARS